MHEYYFQFQLLWDRYASNQYFQTLFYHYSWIYSISASEGRYFDFMLLEAVYMEIGTIFSPYNHRSENARCSEQRSAEAILQVGTIFGRKDDRYKLSSKVELWFICVNYAKGIHNSSVNFYVFQCFQKNWKIRNPWARPGIHSQLKSDLFLGVLHLGLIHNN